MNLKEYIDIRLKEINKNIDEIFEKSDIDIENFFIEALK